MFLTFITIDVTLRKMANGQFRDTADKNISDRFSFYGEIRVTSKEEYTSRERHPKKLLKGCIPLKDKKNRICRTKIV